MISKRYVGFIAAALVLVAAPSLKAADPTVDELRKIIESQRAQVQSMQGIVSAVTTPDEKAASASQMRNIGQKIRINFAWSGPKRLLIDEGDWVSGDMQNTHVAAINAFDGKEFRRRTGKTFLIQPLKSGYSEENIYLYDIRWPLTEAQIVQCRDFPEKSQFLPHCLLDRRWVVRPGHVPINGVPTLLVEKPETGWKMYFDPKRNYCLVRAEYDGPSVNIAHAVYDYENFRRILSGLYLPMTVTVTASMRTEEGKPVGVLTNRVTVQDLQVNNVPDDRFVLKPTPGDYVIDNVRSQTYSYVNTDDETLDVVAQRAALDVVDMRRQRVLDAITTFAIALAVGVFCLRGYSWFSQRQGRKQPSQMA